MKIHSPNKTIHKRSALISGLLAAISSQAATIDVNNNTCTVADAIEAANTDLAVSGCAAGSGDDVIRLQILPYNQSHTITSQRVPSAVVPGTYVGTPIIDSNITIEGQGEKIERPITTADTFRLFEIASGGSLVLNDVRISGGDDGQGIGSGVLNYQGNLEINNSKLYNHHSAITSVYATTTIDNSVVSNNFSNNSFGASAIFSYYSEISMTNSSVINNRFAPLPPLLGQQKKFKDRQLNGGGGQSVPSTILITNSLAELVNSTISGNQNIIGGVSLYDIGVPLRHRFFGNSGNKQNKGILYSQLLMSHVTISDNSGYTGGLYTAGDNLTATVEGSIIAGNRSLFDPIYENGANFSAGTINLDANNIIGDQGQSGFYNFTLGASDFSFSNAASDNLYPLNLSNDQFVHPLKVGSVAIDGLPKSCYQGLLFDQEGKARGIDGNSDGSFICDVGAFEHSLPIIVNEMGCTLNNAIISANNDGSIGGCQPGKGHDIIELPENSSHISSTIVDSYVINGTVVFPSGFPVISSGIIINGHGSTIARDLNSAEDFNLLTVAGGKGLILNDSTVSGASASFAAVAAWYESELQVHNSTISNNATTGVLVVQSQNSAVRNSSIVSNTASIDYPNTPGGLFTIFNHGFVLENSLIANNSSELFGGVISQLDQNIVVRNNTISGNTGLQAAGGIVLQQNSGIVTHNTITNNSSYSTGGVFAGYQLGLDFSHNIVSGNNIIPPGPRATDQPQGGSYAEMVSADSSNLNTRFNIFGANDLSGSFGFVLDVSDSIPSGSVGSVIDVNLADNGGPTLTHLPAANSMAIDAGSDDCEFNLIDQRNFIRPWDGDNDGTSRCDIGAVEANSVAVADLIFKDGFDAVIMLRR